MNIKKMDSSMKKVSTAISYEKVLNFLFLLFPLSEVRFL